MSLSNSSKNPLPRQAEQSAFTAKLNLVMPIVRPLIRGLTIHFDPARELVILTQKAERQELPFKLIEAAINGDEREP